MKRIFSSTSRFKITEREKSVLDMISEKINKKDVITDFGLENLYCIKIKSKNNAFIIKDIMFELDGWFLYGNFKPEIRFKRKIDEVFNKKYFITGVDDAGLLYLFPKKYFNLGNFLIDKERTDILLTSIYTAADIKDISYVKYFQESEMLFDNLVEIEKSIEKNIENYTKSLEEESEKLKNLKALKKVILTKEVL